MEYLLLLGMVGVAVWWAAKQASRVRVQRLAEQRGASPTAGDADVSFFEIGSQFFADVSSSPNGRFKVGACDHHDDGGHERRGACALLENERVLFKRPVRRANNPHVTNEGTLLVEDWKDEGKLNGAFLAFDRTGQLLWRHEFKANIGTSGVSEDGRRAFVTTCNSDYDAHSGMTFLIDVATGKLVWKRGGWGDVSFRGNDCVAGVRHLDGTESFFPFDENGHLGPGHATDCARLEAEAKWGRYWDVLPRVEVGLKYRGVKDLDEVAALLAQLDGKDDELAPKSRAKLLRYRGDLAEARGNLEQAQLWWEKAYVLDPKVGVRRKLAKTASLRK